MGTNNELCQYSLIECPYDGDCDIQCTTYISCDYTHINAITTKNINLNCTHHESCSYLYLFANYSDTINISCIGDGRQGKWYYSCRYISIFADNISNKLTLISMGGSSSSYVTVYARYANDVRLKFVGNKAGGNSVIHLEYAKNATISCHANEDDMSCQSMTVFYPLNNHTSDINLICVGLGCKNLNLKLPFNWDNFNIQIYGCRVCNSVDNCIDNWQLYCGNPRYYYSSFSGKTCSRDWCDCDSIYNQINYIDDDDNMCESLVDYVCTEEYCTIDCSTTDCNSKFIDASKVTSLTVLCDDTNPNTNYVCSYLRVRCPLKEQSICNVSCSNNNACQYSKIYTNGYAELFIDVGYNAGYRMDVYVSDNSNATINCSESYSCRNNQINADYATNVDILCYVNDESKTPACQYMNINGKNISGYLNVSCIGDYACNSLNIYVQRANKAIINSNGEYGLQSSSIHADDATYLRINCRTFGKDSCSGLIVNAPEKVSNNYRAHLRCEGYGCQSIIWRSPYGFEDMDAEIYGCGECKSVADCVGVWSIYCTKYISDWRVHDRFDGTTCQPYNYGLQGCNTSCIAEIDRINNSFSSFRSQDLCGLFNPDIFCTNANTNCHINCTNSIDCSNVIISGENASAFTLLCNDANTCSNSKIYCPYNENNECNIVCSNNNACTNLEINATRNVS